mmetsp:Transcript_39863/g.124627  ORF Transcript_39863/g.124627 Transcript_39863/m.124627 type:complete len:202 (+) Transcript_39863:152-757(+)
MKNVPPYRPNPGCDVACRRRRRRAPCGGGRKAQQRMKWRRSAFVRAEVVNFSVFSCWQRKKTSRCPTLALLPKRPPLALSLLSQSKNTRRRRPTPLAPKKETHAHAERPAPQGTPITYLQHLPLKQNKERPSGPNDHRQQHSNTIARGKEHKKPAHDVDHVDDGACGRLRTVAGFYYAISGTVEEPLDLTTPSATISPASR